MKISRSLVYIIISSLIPVFGSGPACAAETGVINGSVYCDQNRNGECDLEDKGLNDIRIQVFREVCGGAALQVTHTNSRGKFQFNELEADTYFVRADVPCVCGGRRPTTSTCQQVVLYEGEVVNLPPFGYTEFGQ